MGLSISLLSGLTTTPVDLSGELIGLHARAEILIHEGMHAADNSNTSVSADIHIPEFQAAYNVQPADLSLFNPGSYAGFAAHIANNGDLVPRFGLVPGARQRSAFSILPGFGASLIGRDGQNASTLLRCLIFSRVARVRSSGARRLDEGDAECTSVSVPVKLVTASASFIASAVEFTGPKRVAIR